MHAHPHDVAAPLRLITVSFSHFCEKARWALDRANLAYREESHVPLFSWPATFGAGGGRTVPVLVTPGRVVSDSTDILHWVDGATHAPPLFPAGDAGREVAAWEEELDRRLGPATRRVIYFHVMKQRAQAERLLASAGGRWQQRALRLCYPVIRGLIVKGLDINPAGAERSRAVIDEVFARVAATLADGRRYLVGDRLTAADLTFAALAVPVIVPDELASVMPARDQVPTAITDLIAHYRATPAGAFALRLYAEERARRMC
jgi:glutathione S-transferase